jgi:hypothetical protein
MMLKDYVVSDMKAERIIGDDVLPPAGRRLVGAGWRRTRRECNN